MAHSVSTQMSNPSDVIRRHRKLTEDIRTRVSTDMREDLQSIAAKQKVQLSDTAREAFAEYIATHKPSRVRK